MLWTFCKLLLRRTICNLVARNTRIVMFSFYLLREFKKMAALIGRMWRSAFTHVLRDVSNVSPRIQPSNSLKNSVYIDYLSCHMKKNLTEKCIHFFFFYINSNFLKSYYQLIKWALLQYCLSKAVGSIDIVSNFFFLQVVIHVQDGFLVRMPTHCRQAEVCPPHLIVYLLINLPQI